MCWNTFQTSLCSQIHVCTVDYLSAINTYETMAGAVFLHTILTFAFAFIGAFTQFSVFRVTPTQQKQISLALQLAGCRVPFKLILYFIALPYLNKDIYFSKSRNSMKLQIEMSCIQTHQNILNKKKDKIRVLIAGYNPYNHYILLD